MMMKCHDLIIQIFKPQLINNNNNNNNNSNLNFKIRIYYIDKEIIDRLESHIVIKLV